jgi:quinol monooxygenase YgiN
MIIRIFRVEIDPTRREAFERGFYTTSVNAVKDHSGFISCDIGSPTKWSPNTYVMITKWQDENALVAFAGENWNVPVIPVGMESFATTCSVDHYWQEE